MLTVLTVLFHNRPDSVSYQNTARVKEATWLIVKNHVTLGHTLYDIQGLGPMWINLADHNFVRDGTKSHHPWRPPSPNKAKKEKKNRERKHKYAQYFCVTLTITLKHHVYGKRQTSDSSWEFLKIENEQIKRSAQNNSYGWKIAWNY